MIFTCNLWSDFVFCNLEENQVKLLQWTFHSYLTVNLFNPFDSSIFKVVLAEYTNIEVIGQQAQEVLLVRESLHQKEAEELMELPARS